MGDALLIELVQSFPHLYDFKNKNFKNYELKETSWKTIARTLEVSVSECKRTWGNLRNKYAREMKNEKRKCLTMGSADAESKVWEFFYPMSFLNDHIKPRRSFTHVSRRDQYQSHSELQSDPEIGEILEELHKPELIESVPRQKRSQSDPEIGEIHKPELIESIPQQKRKRNTPLDPLDYDFDDRSQAPKISPNGSTPNGYHNRCGASDDESTTAKKSSNLIFGQYVGLSLDGMPEREQKNKRLKICQILEDGLSYE